MNKTGKSVLILAMISIVAATFYASAWYNESLTMSGKFFCTGVIAMFHGGVSIITIFALED